MWLSLSGKPIENNQDKNDFKDILKNIEVFIWENPKYVDTFRYILTLEPLFEIMQSDKHFKDIQELSILGLVKLDSPNYTYIVSIISQSSDVQTQSVLVSNNLLKNKLFREMLENILD